MKFKRTLTGVLVGLSVLLLGACGKNNAQQEFADNFKTSIDSEYNASTFNLSLDDFNYSGGEDAFSINMLAAQLKNVKVEGSYAVDYENNSLESEMNFSILNQKFPIQIVGNKENLYMSTSFISGMYNIASAFNSSMSIPSSTISKLDGKYVDLLEMIEVQNDINLEDYFDVSDTKAADELNAALKKEILTFDKDSFKKSRDTLSHKFTKEECTKLFNVAMEHYKKDLDSEEKKQFEKAQKEYAKSLKDVNLDYSVAVKINTKTKQTESKIKVSLANPNKKSEKMTMAFKYVMELKKNKNAITMPKKSEVLTSDEIDEIMNSATNSRYDGEDSLGDYDSYFDSSDSGI